MKESRPGSVILMHDSGPSTAEALRDILKALSARGHAFVTVPELYGSRGMTPGKVYPGAASGAAEGSPETGMRPGAGRSRNMRP